MVRTPISGPMRFTPRYLAITEIDADDRIAAHVMFDADDIDAAFAELDARYLAGEAVAVPGNVVGHRGGPTRLSHGPGAATAHAGLA